MSWVTVQCFTTLLLCLTTGSANQAHTGSLLNAGIRRVALQERRSTKDHIRGVAAVAAANLAAALRNELPAGVRSARSRLVEEANRLQRHDTHGAELLRSYAQFAPGSVLILPVYENVGNYQDLDDAPMELADDVDDNMGNLGSSSESEQTVYTSDGGRATTIRTHCQDGHCTEQKSVGPAALPGQNFDTRMQQHSNSVSKAVSAMVDSMRAAEKAFGIDDFQDILKDGFSSPEDGRRWPDFKGREDADNSSDGKMVVSETVTSVDGDGHMVTRSRKCANGKCTTQVDEKKVAPVIGGRRGWPMTPDAMSAGGQRKTMPEAESNTEPDMPI